MTSAEQQTRDLLNTISDEPITFTWGEADYVGTAGALGFPDDLEPGGFLKDYDKTILTTIQVLNNGVFENRFGDSEPANGDEITIDEIDYIVKRVTLDSLGVAIRLDLENADK